MNGLTFYGIGVGFLKEHAKNICISKYCQKLLIKKKVNILKVVKKFGYMEQWIHFQKSIVIKFLGYF